MNSFTYSVDRVGNDLMFYFVSRDSHGNNPGVHYYNLGFGDYDVDTGRYNDTVISNNGDMRKILRTVVSTLTIFFKEHPDRAVYINGSDQTRKDYYHKLINDYWYRIQELYLVEGCNKGTVEIFQKGMKYEFILISLKKV